MNSDKEIDIQQKIDLYLSNAMSESDRIEFEVQLQSDASLMEQMLLQKSIAETLFDKEFDHIADESTKAALEQIRSTLETEPYQEHQKQIADVAQIYQKRRQQKRRWFIGVAAAVLLVASAVFWFPRKPSYESLYAEYADWTELTSYTEQNDTNEFAKGERLYKKGLYSQAIEFFDNFTQDKNNTLYAPGLLYLGASYAGNNQPNKALDEFDKLIQSNSYDRSKGYWYKLLIYLQQENTSEVENTLELILKDPANFNYKKAQIIKESL